MAPMRGLISLNELDGYVQMDSIRHDERLVAQVLNCEEGNAWQLSLKQSTHNVEACTWVARHDNASVLGRHGSVIIWKEGQGLLLSDVSYAFDSSGWNRVRHPDLQRRHLPGFERIRGEAVVISCPYANNYFHFLFDSLPRLLDLDENSSCQVILNDERSFQREYYELLGLSLERRVPVSGSSHWKPDELIVPSIPLPELNMLGAVAPHACDFLRQIMNHSRVCAQSSPARKIWIGRRSGRNYANAEAVSEWLVRHAFIECFLEELSVMEQIALFRDADVVAGIHGAGLANLVYCRPGTRVVEVLPEHWGWPFYRSLSAAVGLDYRCVSASADEPLREEDVRLTRIQFTLGDLAEALNE
ncbi:MAG: glycosyltransferase family 61 protein [Verrucomicrobia bacterium]|nr:glycosyltransferase family 61 protein [Verrucomicrobiota bacterium]